MSQSGTQRWSCATLGDGIDQVAMQSLLQEEAAILRELEERTWLYVASMQLKPNCLTCVNRGTPFGVLIYMIYSGYKSCFDSGQSPGANK